MNYKSLKTLALTAIFSVAAAMPVAARNDLSYKRISERDTLVLEAQTQERLDSRTMRFSVDVSDVTEADYWAHKNIAIKPKDETVSDGQVCPYFNLQARDYDLKATHPSADKKIMEITVRHSEDEYKAAERSGCVIASWPSMGRLLQVM